jgi:hypothetical protein
MFYTFSHLKRPLYYIIYNVLYIMVEYIYYDGIGAKKILNIL